MNWVDLVVIGIVAVSALMAFGRGFAREALGIGAWLGAGLVALYTGEKAIPQVKALLPANMDQMAQPAAYAAVFVIALVVLLLVSHWVSALVQGSMLSGLDRTLGLVFGMVRALVLLVVVYGAVGQILPISSWPAPVLQSRSLPIAYEGAMWLVGLLPEDLRAKVQPRVPVPPEAPTPSADALMQPTPSGRANDAAPARP